MIRTLWIESFKAFLDDPGRTAPGISLQPFTVLVGPNGSGKSTILQAIDTLGWLSAGTIKWNGEQATFNARQVSDGLLRLIAVAAMHEMREPPSVLLLDEIENGLHPRLLGGLVAMLEELTRTGMTQVIATTHSPITLNYVSSPESVLLVTRGKGGGVQVTPMNETRNFQELREHFELGELWYNAGEERLVPGKKGR